MIVFLATTDALSAVFFAVVVVGLRAVLVLFTARVVGTSATEVQGCVWGVAC